MVNKKLSINKPDDLIHHEKLKAVEKNPGDTTDNKYSDNADEDDSHVHLISDLCLSGMCVPTVSGLFCELNICDWLDDPIDPGVEVWEAGEGENAGGDQAEKVQVVSTANIGKYRFICKHWTELELWLHITSYWKKSLHHTISALKETHHH